jgi:hypothetical protein
MVQLCVRGVRCAHSASARCAAETREGLVLQPEALGLAAKQYQALDIEVACACVETWAANVNVTAVKARKLFMMSSDIIVLLIMQTPRRACRNVASGGESCNARPWPDALTVEHFPGTEGRHMIPFRVNTDF